MTGQITLPLWLFILLVLLTAWSILDRMLVPSVRWFLRRRINRVLDEISTHLDIEIRPFQLTKRQVLIDRLAYDPKVMEAVQHFAQKENKPREIVQAEVEGYAKEIVPSFNAYMYFRLGYWLAKKVARLLYRVRMGLAENERLAGINPDATVVFVMNHRSNMDYILVAFLAAERTALSYAVGEWARIWPLQMLFKFMGAFFVRRNSGNTLYRLVLERYIRMATKEGVCQAVFLEGGLSRDGLLRSPKLGLLDYMLRGYEPENDRDIVFIPVGINYDRTLEDRSLLRALDPSAEKRSLWFVTKTILGFVWHNIILMLFRKWQRFGYACVNFGQPVSTRDYCLEHSVYFSILDRSERFSKVEDFSRTLMHSIEQIIPVLPFSLTAAVFKKHPQKKMNLLDVKVEVHQLIEQLESAGAGIYYPSDNYEETIEAALSMMKIRRMIKESEGYYQMDPDMEDIISYYANSINHWLD